MVYGKPHYLDVGRDLAHSWSASAHTRHGDAMHPAERRHRQQEAVHGGGVHGSGVWVTERDLNDWHLQNSIKYAGYFHPEYCATPVPVSHLHSGLHDANLDFKTAVRGIVPGYAGHVPRARDMYGQPLSGGITPDRGWKRAPKQYIGPMGSRAHDHGPEGAASRPHAYTRSHNRVSDEIKPGYMGHVPVARDTHGTSFYRDTFTHLRAIADEDGNISSRSTASTRYLSPGSLQHSQRNLHGNAQGWKSDRQYGSSHAPQRPAGLNDRERFSGRARSAPRVLKGSRVSSLEVTI